MLRNRALCCRRATMAALLVAMAGCSTPGDQRAEAPGAAYAKSATPGDKRPDAPVAPPRSTAPRTRLAVSKGERQLQRGIRSYEEAEYEIAVKNLNSALNLGLSARGDMAKAYKYLAFVDCTSGRMTSCRAQFRNALDVDPNFELAPAEAGHPIWGPVFRSVKVGSTGKTKAR